MLMQMAESPSVRALRLTSGLCYLALATCAGAAVFWPLRQQTAHAVPAAIAVACLASSLAAGFAGWKLGAAYRKTDGRIAWNLWIPTVIYVVTVVVASVSYYAIVPLFNPFARGRYFELPQMMQMLQVGATLYGGIALPVWLLGLPLCMLAIRRRAATPRETGQ